MAKERLMAVLHQPVTAILGTRAKVAVVRILATAAGKRALAYREVVRRSGMGYASIDLALGELSQAGIVEELDDVGRERRVRLCASHRLVPALTALIHAEGDFYSALRSELRTVLAPLEREGLIAAALVGKVAARVEGSGDPCELLLIATNPDAVTRVTNAANRAAPDFGQRFGVVLKVIGYDREGARAIWARRTPATQQAVQAAESLIGPPISEVVE